MSAEFARHRELGFGFGFLQRGATLMVGAEFSHHRELGFGFGFLQRGAILMVGTEFSRHRDLGFGFGFLQRGAILQAQMELLQVGVVLCPLHFRQAQVEVIEQTNDADIGNAIRFAD